jgi:hypothetical protein
MLPTKGRRNRQPARRGGRRRNRLGRTRGGQAGTHSRRPGRTRPDLQAARLGPRAVPTKSLSCRRARRGEEEGAGARCVFLGASCLYRLGHRRRELSLPTGAPTARGAGRGGGIRGEDESAGARSVLLGASFLCRLGRRRRSSSRGRWRREEAKRER